MRPILRSPAPILLLILAIPLAANAYTITTGPASPELSTELGIVFLVCLTAAYLLFVALVRQRSIGRRKQVNELWLLRYQAIVLLLDGFLIALSGLVLAVALPAIGLVASAVCIAWVLLWLTPQSRRMSTATTYVIKRSPEVVFDFVADRRNGPRWIEGMESVEMLTAEPIRAGSRFREHVRLPRFEIVTVEEIFDYEPSRRMTSRLTDRGPGHTWPLTPSSWSTAVRGSRIASTTNAP